MHETLETRVVGCDQVRFLEYWALSCWIARWFRLFELSNLQRGSHIFGNDKRAFYDDGRKKLVDTRVVKVGFHLLK